MPYLDGPWTVDGQHLPAGTWVPERNWDRWKQRDPGNEHEWRKRPKWALAPEPSTSPEPEPEGGPPSKEGPPSQGSPPEGEPANAPKPRIPETLLKAMLPVLAADIVSVQRDALIYTNQIERLKNSPNDETADAVIDDMITLGFASACWPPEVGGPPPRRSMRPWKQVLNWLFRQAAKATTILLEMVDVLLDALQALGAQAVAIGTGLPPQVSFEFPPELPNWPDVREYFFGPMVREQLADTF